MVGCQGVVGLRHAAGLGPGGGAEAGQGLRALLTALLWRSKHGVRIDVDGSFHGAFSCGPLALQTREEGV